MEQSFFIMETTRKSGSRTNTLKKQKSPRNNDFNGLLVFQFFFVGLPGFEQFHLYPLYYKSLRHSVYIDVTELATESSKNASNHSINELCF